MVTINSETGVPLHKDTVFMLHFWSVVAGIAATLIVSWLWAKQSRRVKTSVNSQKKLLPHTDDHDRFHHDVQSQQMAPEDLEIGPILGAGTFGEVFRGEKPLRIPKYLPATGSSWPHLSPSRNDLECIKVWSYAHE